MTAAVCAEGLTKRYGHTVALDGLDLEIQPGEVFGYLGPNGAGKSTTIAMLLGFVRPSSGRARIFDLDVRRDTRPRSMAGWPTFPARRTCGPHSPARR